MSLGRAVLQWLLAGNAEAEALSSPEAAADVRGLAPDGGEVQLNIREARQEWREGASDKQGTGGSPRRHSPHQALGLAKRGFSWPGTEFQVGKRAGESCCPAAGGPGIWDGVHGRGGLARCDRFTG